jgi:cyclophilin family peptidyl-prolyl cis-trans isomerase
MHRLFIILHLILFTSSLHSQDDPVVLISTKYGDMKIKLYSNTPLHTSNFIELAEKGYFNGLLFHRVINNFMIQTGDPKSKNSTPGQVLGNGGPGYTIPAEFVPQYYHKKGAVAAARQGDAVNPDKESSGSQFYIVQGQTFTKEQLDLMVSRGMHIPFTQNQIKDYTTIGGSPHLDYSYTVFGEVIDGLDVIDKIAAVATDKRNRPLEDIVINVKVLKK